MELTGVDTLAQGAKLGVEQDHALAVARHRINGA